MKPIYLDYNATTPIDPEVAEAMLPYLQNYFGNPSSSHWYGIQTKKAVEHARKQIAGLIKACSNEIIFTSGGTESNNYAIKGVAFAHRERGNHIITSSVEHPAVTEVCGYLESFGFRTTYLPVDKYGQVSPEDVKQAITPETVLITIMHANNEVGTIQPVREIAEIAKKHNIIVHTDAAQSMGKIPVHVDELGVDLLSVAGHKLYAHKGIGALCIRKGIKLEKFMHGAGHERGRRAGTENVLEIAGLGKACEIAGRDLGKNMAHMKHMRDHFHNILKASRLDFRINGHPKERLPNTLNVSFHNIDALTILSVFTEVAASAGAACHSDQISISPVLKAMGVSPDYAAGTIRFSTGKFTTEEEINRAADIVIKLLSEVQFKEKDTGR